MPSTDIDGSPLVILSKEEALCVHDHLVAKSSLLRTGPLEQQVIRKIIRDLELEQPEEQIKEQTDDV
jgi:hypothetical protein